MERKNAQAAIAAQQTISSVGVGAEDEQPLRLEDEVAPVPGLQQDPVINQLPESKVGGAPAWAKIPSDLKFPRGRQVAFLRFRQEWTDTPASGERQCIVWSLTDADEKMALSRAMGDAARAASELTKQMLRSVDGFVADWSGAPSPANIDTWWRDIGARCRQMLIRIYTQLHVLSEDERKDFFENCIELRSAG